MKEQIIRISSISLVELDEIVLEAIRRVKNIEITNTISSSTNGKVGYASKFICSSIDYSVNADNCYCCYWCRSKIPSLEQQIGCPISRVNNLNFKKYTSFTSSHEYIIDEEVHDTLTAKYQSDGIFCSFNCCMAYINDNKKNPLYDDSRVLLVDMYNRWFETNVPTIEAAPHWRLLQDYGGNLDIQQFRDSFTTHQYTHQGIITDDFASVHTIFSSKIRL